LIESRITRGFREAYVQLPDEVRRRERDAYRLFEKNPHHPSLRFKKADQESNTYSVRIGLGYRAPGVMRGSRIVWHWIGSHADYDRLA
jgi:hypothetical protein